MNIIGIARAPRYSPNSVERDRAILDAVVGRLHGVVVDADGLTRQQLGETAAFSSLIPSRQENRQQAAGRRVVFSMARDPATLAWLKDIEAEGVLVLNSPQGVENCRRSRLTRLLRQHRLPLPPEEGPDGYWLKRGDAAAQSAADVVFCPDKAALSSAVASFRRRGIGDYVVQAHVRGDLLKFYGVEGTGFFRYFYPGDDGDWKFGDERRNGPPRHYFFPKEHLQAAAEMAARLAQVPIYGGDAVVTPDGDFVLIDFNDWPSFSRCRDEAAAAITSLIIQ